MSRTPDEKYITLVDLKIKYSVNFSTLESQFIHAFFIKKNWIIYLYSL